MLSELRGQTMTTMGAPILPSPPASSTRRAATASGSFTTKETGDFAKSASRPVCRRELDGFRFVGETTTETAGRICLQRVLIKAHSYSEISVMGDLKMSALRPAFA